MWSVYNTSIWCVTVGVRWFRGGLKCVCVLLCFAEVCLCENMVRKDCMVSLGGKYSNNANSVFISFKLIIGLICNLRMTAKKKLANKTIKCIKRKRQRGRQKERVRRGKRKERCCIKICDKSVKLENTTGYPYFTLCLYFLHFSTKTFLYHCFTLNWIFKNLYKYFLLSLVSKIAE